LLTTLLLLLLLALPRRVGLHVGPLRTLLPGRLLRRARLLLVLRLLLWVRLAGAVLLIHGSSPRLWAGWRCAEPTRHD